MSQPETILLAEIRLALGREARQARLFRNPSGVFWAGKVLHRDGGSVTLAHPQQVHVGLREGAADLVGWTKFNVTQEMVGQDIALFTSAEVKVQGARTDKKRAESQLTWRQNIIAAGGIAGVVQSPAEAVELVRRWPCLSSSAHTALKLQGAA